MHDALDGLVGRLQHLVVVGIDRDVGVHVAVAGMHVQRDENAAAQHFLVDRRNALDDGAIDRAVENLGQARFQFLLPRDAHRVILQAVEEPRIGGLVGQLAGMDAVIGKSDFGVGQRHVQIFQQPGPAAANRCHVFQRRLPAVADQNVLVDVGITVVQRQVALQKLRQRIAQRQLVLRRQLDVDALDAVAVVAHARQRDHHVLVDLEGVGVARDGGGARAVEPEFLACFGVNRDEAFGRAQVANAHDFRGSRHHCLFVVTDEVADQHHLRPTMALGLGRVADGLHVALVEVLEAGQLHAGRWPAPPGLK